jgi:hypothetical protein
MTVAVERDRKRGPVEYAHRVRPGFTRADLARLFAERGYTRGAEIGVADGRNSLTLCQHIPGLQLLCVDPWQAYPGNPRGGPQPQHNGNFDLAQERLRDFSLEFWRLYSVDAARDYRACDGVTGQPSRPPLDFVYIDGNHSFDYVIEDLIEWSKNVRSGGIVSGHDFYEFKWAGVVEAVVAYTGAHGITDWWLCDEREPSFWWVKP